MQAVSHIQRLMQEEGAFFHPLIRIESIPAMGGGYGVVAEGRIPPGTLLARIPRCLMITPGGVRHYLARCECRWRNAQVGIESHLNEEFNAAALLNLERELAHMLSPANTIVCFLLLAAMRHGRLAASSVSKTWIAAVITEEQDEADGVCTRGWMREWLLSLPLRYDNLLELQPHVDGDVECDGEAARDAYLRPFLCFQRHREKVLQEQDNMMAEFRACQSVLSLLDAARCTDGETPLLSPPIHMEQFTWAYNTLMTRGFAYDPEVWALMPWVDYFNYALTSNATMSFDEGRQAYIFETVLPIEKGEQVLLHYGSYTDMELLLWYGFTLTPSLMPELYSSGNSCTHESRSQILRMLLRHNFGHGSGGGDDKVSLTTRDDIWLNAAQRAFGYLFAPWAEVDGSYPRPKPGESWLELLFASYTKRRSSTNAGGVVVGGFHSPTAVVAIADALAEAFLAMMRTRQTPPQLILHDCRLGARGPSPSMLKLLKYVSSVCCVQGKGTRWAPSDVLRVICWAELFCNGDCIHKYGGGSACHLGLWCEPVMSALDGVKRMAWQASRDAASLLHFLAVEATVEELTIYLSARCE